SRPVRVDRLLEGLADQERGGAGPEAGGRRIGAAQEIAGELEHHARVAHGRPRIQRARFSADRARSMVGTGPSAPCAPRLSVWKVSGNPGSCFLSAPSTSPPRSGSSNRVSAISLVRPWLASVSSLSTAA